MNPKGTEGTGTDRPASPFSRCEHNLVKPSHTMRLAFPERGMMVWYCNVCQARINVSMTTTSKDAP
jgi:hypothetical protein